ncbi:hypothetical protein [Nocardia sp. IFM 10818]
MIGARLAVLGAVVLIAAGCTSNKGAKVDESLTGRQAQQRIYELMTETLRALPPGAVLSKTPDSPLLGKDTNLYPIAVPCWSGNTQSEGPHYLSIGYWITGLPQDATGEYFNKISKIWQDRGWQETDSSRLVFVTKTEDGYGLHLQNADKGDGSLSLTGTSPCISDSALEPLDPDPTEIKAL